MHVPFVWWLVLHVCVLTVAASHQPPAWERITIQTASIHPSACHRKLFLWAGAEATGDYFWALSPVFFSKGRSRVWLMSRLSWTGWLASKTPWCQLTTYHHRQRTKREGNKNSCIVHLILWKNICTCELKKKQNKKKLTKFLTPVSVSTQWFHWMRFKGYQKVGEGVEMRREREHKWRY